MAVQQRRVSKSRKGMRRSHHHLTENNVVVCESCGVAKQPHRICRECGFYKGRAVIKV